MDRVQLLEDTYARFIGGLTHEIPLDMLAEMCVEDVMGFGTTSDEKIFSIHELHELFVRQIEQSQGIQLQHTLTPLLRRLSADGNTAVYVDDILLNLTIGNEKIDMYLRFSSVMEYIQDRWRVLHWHGSKPEYVESDKDTFGIEEWKEKNAALEKLVAERTAELIKQKEELEQALKELRITQAQLIQSEKMASLGELTAGIAHEIQNPLNFINNFSEVNKELLVELKEEIEKQNFDMVSEIANDVITNEEKIHHHGKRADSIVKGMLQHSSTGSGKKELTNINSLADEYLRLSYHGIRAKNKSFNAVLKTEYDESIGDITIVSQDIGRVILNLITNAFYAVEEKRKAGVEQYQPTVAVSTKKENDKVLISIQDNGNGIPEKIMNKIFQPFFTTKPTGQGTGLGLSIAYDIVKAHQGELRVQANTNEGAEFIIQLPVNNV